MNSKKESFLILSKSVMRIALHGMLNKGAPVRCKT